ncbi:hypothetical protein QBC40DRAFT_39652 [Triangularia verruculosa]|uniref:Uncharacterized protein n=1 Tax=Triangularia verruculosa TaxID=2587418 RepID=A0AAN6XP08_9PEZI|nr:hypothetical protein QBC40DRAFT_39652 [Triangularia verruculosa]
MNNPRRLNGLTKEYWDKVLIANNAKFRFSAAAAAIHFLGQLPPTIRPHFRKIILDENAESSPFPQGHTEGLIPFCHENPALRIERRVNLWNNVFLGTDYGSGYGSGWFIRGIDDYELHDSRLDDIDSDIPENVSPLSSTEGLEPGRIAESLSFWLAEALVLCDTGMPRGVFTLALDAGPMRDVTTRIFDDVVHRHAAWQRAMETHFNLEPKDDTMASFFQQHHPLNRVTERLCSGFPGALDDLIHGTSSHGVRFRSNFDAGVAWTAAEVDSLIQKSTQGPLQQWVRNFNTQLRDPDRPTSVEPKVGTTLCHPTQSSRSS